MRSFTICILPQKVMEDETRRGMRIGFCGKSEGKKPLGRHRSRWEDSKKMDLKEIGWGGMDWVDLV
jgi:hypothetical protein